MQGRPHNDMRTYIDGVYRAESRRVFATLIRLVGDFDAAEEALHDAFRAALEQWPRDGIPENPRAWLVSAGRFKAIDNLRRNARFTALDDEQLENLPDEREAVATGEIEDDRLRLIFTCCHPALQPDAPRGWGWFPLPADPPRSSAGRPALRAGAPVAQAA